jgi:hypothetical protein
MRNVRSLVLIFSGIAIGLCGGAFCVRHAQAQTAAPALRYQYKCITGATAQMYKPAALAALNQEGSQGWQLLDGLSAQNHLSGADQYCFMKQY